MKTAIIIGIVLIIIIVLYFIRKSSSSVEGVTDISSEKANQLIKENQASRDFVILDVRTPGEFSSGHIKGAVNIDYHNPGFQKSLDSLDREKTYLVYCRSGNRSSHAAAMMKKMNFSRLYNLQGGILMYKP